VSSGATSIFVDRRAGAAGKSGAPWTLVAGAFVTGMVLARLIDWRAHGHPRL